MSTMTLIREKVLKIAESLPDIHINYIGVGMGYISFTAYRFVGNRTYSEDFALRLAEFKKMRLATIDKTLEATVKNVVKRLNDKE
jgi:hypothetical protein